MVTAGKWKKVATLCLLATALTGTGAQSDPAEAIAYPGSPPVIPTPTTQEDVPVELDGTLLEDLQARDFATREAAAATLVRIGLPAIPALQELALTADDDDTLWWVRAIIQNIEDNATRRLGNNLFDLLAKGPSVPVLATLKSLSLSTADALIEKHLRLEVGMDCVYSLKPAQVMPKAVELLQMQTEPFYQATLLRLMRNVLERAQVPSPAVALSSTFPDLAGTVHAFLAHPHPELRREALQIMAWGNLPVSENVVQDLLQDPSPAVACEAFRLQRLLVADAVAVPDPDVAPWIGECTAALGQEADPLAQLGAYYALYELVCHFPGDLADAVAALDEGRAKDALVWLLCQDAGGRAHLLRAGWERLPKSAPASLRKLLTLRAYDLQRSNLARSREAWPQPTLALVWRNLVNDDACGYSSISRRTTQAKLFFDELEIFGYVDLGKGNASSMRRPKGIASTSEFEPWYGACARNALSSRTPISTGAIRGLLVSDLAGARALASLYGELVANEPDLPTEPSLARDLFLLHPCIDLLDDAELSPALRARWYKRRTEYVPVPGGGERPRLDAFPFDMPIALWGFFMQNDCGYMNPAGHYLADHLSMEHLPLLLAFLEYNSRATIFLAELDAREAVPAITREVLARRKNYYRSYDHDLFHGVAHFGILDAAPVLETYTKQNDNWPGKGVMTLAGFEDSRYCWTEETTAAAPNPLAAGILREIADHLQAGRHACRSSDYRIGEFCDKGLEKMGVPMNTVPPS